jgi:DNA-directed RNA polymerase specialized sigma24 family protein
MARPADRSQHPYVSLHVRLGPRLMSYLVRRVNDTETAADLWAECWARAYENWSQRYSENDAVAEAWVFGIARNLLASYYRTGQVKLKALERLRWTVPPVDVALRCARRAPRPCRRSHRCAVARCDYESSTAWTTATSPTGWAAQSKPPEPTSPAGSNGSRTPLIATHSISRRSRTHE